MKLLLVGASGSLGSRFKTACSQDFFGSVICVTHSSKFSTLDQSNYLSLDITSKSHLNSLFSLHPDISHVIFTPELRYIFPLLSFFSTSPDSPRIICFSSQAIFTTIPYSKNKEWRILAEKIALNSNLDLVILRLNMVFGHLADRNISLMHRAVSLLPILPIIVTNVYRSAIISPVYIDDLVKCVFNIINSTLSPGLYNVSGFAPISTAKFIKLSAKLNSKFVLLFPIPIFFVLLPLSFVLFFKPKIFLRFYEFSYRFIEDKHLLTSPVLIYSGLYRPTQYSDSLVFSFFESI